MIVSKAVYNLLRLFLLPGLMFGGAMQVLAAAENGMENLPEASVILGKIQDKTRSFTDMSSTVEMRTIEANGKETVRSMEFKVLQGKNGEWVKSLLVFKKPKREKGVALLSHAHKSTRNKQWLYFPSARRVKSIAGKKSSGSFMGSEFRYTDLLPKPLEDFHHKTLEKAELFGKSHWVIERVSKDSADSVGKQRLWVDVELEIIKQVEFLNGKGDLVKTLSAEQFEVVEDVQRPKLLVMKNHQNGRATQLLTLSMSVNEGLIEDDFSETALDFAR